jgi:hypothetical protein
LERIHCVCGRSSSHHRDPLPLGPWLPTWGSQDLVACRPQKKPLPSCRAMAEYSSFGSKYPSHGVRVIPFPLSMLLLGVRVPSMKANPSSSARQILPPSNIIIIKLFFSI